MKTTTKRARPGDVLEINVPEGFVYLHYVGKHADYGDAIVVSPAIRVERPSDLSQIFKHGYVAFYPVNAAISHKLVQVVGRTEVPGDLPPVRLRRAGARSDHGVETWVIEDESGETVKRTLSDEERQLPIGAIWNHEFLLQRVAEGWRPEKES